MKNLTQKERFEILNTKYLGYGSPDIKTNIIFIGIEEYSTWSIPEILSCSMNEEIQSFLMKIDSVEDQIQGLRQKFDIDIYKILDNQLRYMSDELSDNPFIYNSQSNSTVEKFSQTNMKQFQLSKKIKKLNEDDYNNFATPSGQEVILNYYPIGRTNEKMHYSELETFFGLRCGMKFLSENDQRIRNELFLRYFRRTREAVSEKLYVFVMGMKRSRPVDSVCHILYPTLKTAFQLPYYDLDETLKKLEYSRFIYGRGTYGYKFESDEIDIYFMPHPSNFRGSDYSNWFYA